jgi:hypothetical protein
MESWTLVCKNCHKAFAYSKIGNTLGDFFLPLRPEIPPEGVERECPNCKVHAIYQRNELRYQSEAKSRGHASGLLILI